jgi:hypothetical protein
MIYRQDHGRTFDHLVVVQVPAVGARWTRCGRKITGWSDPDTAQHGFGWKFELDPLAVRLAQPCHLALQVEIPGNDIVPPFFNQILLVPADGVSSIRGSGRGPGDSGCIPSYGSD